MILSKRWLGSAARAVPLVLLVLVSACSKPAGSGSGDGGIVGASDSGTGATSPQASPAEALASCDKLASAPGDPQRVDAPVADDAFAPGPAVTACADAVAQNADNPRAHFEYGRALVQGGRDADAFEQFKAARLAGYPAASFYLANAYRDGRVPSGATPSLDAAVTLYEEAVKGGVAGADKALTDARRELSRAVFDKSLFQNGDYMEALYTGDFGKAKMPLAVLFYMQGVAAGFEDSNVVFMDQSCKQLVSRAGLDLIRNADGVVAWAQILSATDSSGQWSPSGLGNVMAASLGRSYVFDMGERPDPVARLCRGSREHDAGATASRAAEIAPSGHARTRQRRRSGGLAGVDIISGPGKGDQAALIRDLVRRPMAASRSICSMAATSRAMRSRADSYSWRSE